MNRRKLKIGILGLTPSDGLVLRSILRLSNSLLKEEWEFDDYKASDVLIADPDHPEFGLQLVHSKTSGKPFCISLLRGAQKAATGSHVLATPLRVSDVITILKQVEFAALAEQDEGGAQHGGAFQTAAVKSDQAAVNALKLVRALQKEVQSGSERDLIIRSATQSLIRVQTTKARFCCIDSRQVTSTNGVAILACLGGMKHDALLEKAHTDVDAASLGPWFPLSVLYWHLGVQLLGDNLLPGLNDNMSFKLKSWPDFGTNGADPRLLKLAAFMVRRSLTIAELKSLTQSPTQVIVAFINACALCQLILPIDDSGQRVVIDLHRVIAEKKQDQGLHGVFNAIRSVFKLRA